jgi:hypothetical protein
MKSKFIFIIGLACSTIQSCNAQTSEKGTPCNRQTADKSIEKRLPKGICVPGNYTVDQIITNVDFNHDKKNDVVLRYSEYPLKNGANRLYGFFERVGDATFELKKELKNIIPPYLQNVYAAVSGSDSLASALVKKYPYDLKVEFVQDTIKLSHLIPDYYGKTYEFVFNNQSSNWYLRRIKYWIGGLDERDIEQLDLSKSLVNRNIIDTKLPDANISIEEFNLSESRKTADTEESDYFMNNYNLFEWSQKQN